MTQNDPIRQQCSFGVWSKRCISHIASFCIIQKLVNDEKALGIFGFNFLQENQNIIAGVNINNINPNIENITSQLYPISRPLFIYAKKDHKS